MLNSEGLYESDKLKRQPKPDKQPLLAEIEDIVSKTYSARGLTFHQAAQEILDKIGERIPPEREIPTRGNEYLINKDEGFNECRDELRQALGLAKGG